MHKPSPSRLNAIIAMATTLGMTLRGGENNFSTAEVLRNQRGPARAGMKYITGVYIPAGQHCNVEPTKIRNPKIAANVQMMHEKWLAAKIARIDMQMKKLEALL